MPSFVPRLVLMQRAALDYPLGRELRRRFEGRGIELVFYDRKIPVLSSPPVPGASSGRFISVRRFPGRNGTGFQARPVRVGKYLYPEDSLDALRDFFRTEISKLFPYARVLYFV